MIRILILVHHYIFEAILIFAENFLIIFKKFNAIKQYVIKVHGIIFLQPLGIFSVYKTDCLCFIVIFNGFCILFRRNSFLLAVTYCSKQISGWEFLLIHTLFFDNALNQCPLVCGIIN